MAKTASISNQLKLNNLNGKAYLDQIQDFETSKTSDNLSGKILQLRDKVYEKRPALISITQSYGSKSLYDFSKTHTRTNYSFKNEPRKQEFIKIFKSEVSRLLGSNLAASAEKQINRYYTASTAEHFSPISHSNYLNGNLLSSLRILDSNDPNLKNIFILSCSNVSFDNYVFPRGLLFSSLSGIINQLVFFSRSVRPLPVIYHPSYTKESLDSTKIRLQELLKTGSISVENQKKLLSILEEIFYTDDILNCEYYSEQVTKINYLLWKKLFDLSGTKGPNMIFIEQEKIVNKLLVNHHMNTKTIIGKILFEKKYHKLFLKHFNKVNNAFNLENKTGTVLFWAKPKGKKYREQLWYKDGFLTNNEGYNLKLTPSNLSKALINKELIPSTALSLIILSFYYGLRLRGAFVQTTYLTQMKLAYIEILREVGDLESIENCIDTPTTTLVLNCPTIALSKSSDGEIIPTSTLDVMLHGSKNYLKQIEKNAKNITLNEAITGMLPNIYKGSYPKTEQDPSLSNLTKLEIDKMLGIDKKISAIINLKD